MFRSTPRERFSELPSHSAESVSRLSFLTQARRAAERVAATGLIPTWVFTRVVGDQYTVLATGSELGVVLPTATFRWADTVCAAMTRGDGPRVTADVLRVPAYADSPLARSMGVRAYAGTPVRDRHGTFLGTFCGFDTVPLDPMAELELLRWQPLIDAQAQLLGVELGRQLDLMQQGRSADWERAQHFRDPVTRLPDRRGWDLLLRNEKDRADDLAERLGVIDVELDQTRSSRAMRRAGAVVAELTGDRSHPARIDHRRLGIVCGGLLPGEVGGLARSVEQACRKAGVNVRVGWTMHDRDNPEKLARFEDPVTGPQESPLTDRYAVAASGRDDGGNGDSAIITKELDS